MDIVSLLSLNAVHSLGNRRLARLLEYFNNDVAAAWRETGAWRQALGLTDNQHTELLSERAKIEPEAVYERFCRSGASIVTIFDELYPEPLRPLYDAPVLLFYKGALPPPDYLAFAVIGSRQCTAYGRQAADFLAQGLARNGAWIVGGLARGIDAAGHRGAITAGGKTIGVLGCGIDVIYPRENAKLYAEVEQNGCILSEFPLGTAPLPQHFPIRNRIISGLSDGVIIVEAKKQSGTRITVDYALEQGKELYAVPGPIFSPLSVGTHQLMRELGIKPVTCADEILEDFNQLKLNFNPGPRQPIKDNMSPLERQLVDFLSISRHFNEITEELQLAADEVGQLLTVCELRQYIIQLPGQYYIRNNI